MQYLVALYFFASDAVTAVITVMLAILLTLAILVFGMTSSDVSERDTSKPEKIKTNNDLASWQLDDSLIINASA